jgi:hypothetical protein
MKTRRKPVGVDVLVKNAGTQVLRASGEMKLRISVGFSRRIELRQTGRRLSNISNRLQESMQPEERFYEKIIHARDVAEVSRVLPSGDHRGRQSHLDRRPHGSKGPSWQFARRRLRRAGAADLQEYRSDAEGGWGVGEGYCHDERLPRPQIISVAS